MWLKKEEKGNEQNFFFEQSPWNVRIQNGYMPIFFTNTHTHTHIYMKAVYGKICLFKLIKNDFQSDRDIEMNVNIVNRHILHQKFLWGCKNDGLWTERTKHTCNRTKKKTHTVEVGFPHRKWYQNCTGMWLWIFRPSPDHRGNVSRWSDVFWRDEKGRWLQV